MMWFTWWQQTKLFDRLFLFFGLLVTGLFGLEAISYMGMIENNLGISVWLIAAVVLSGGIVWRGWRRVLPSRLSDTLLFVGTSVVWFGLFLRLLDRVVYSNFVFSTFHVQSMPVVMLGIWLGALSVLTWNRPRVWRHSVWFACLPVWLVGTTLAFGLLYPVPYYELSKEDSVVEYLSALVYLLTGICALLAAGKLWRRPTPTPNLRLVILGAFLLAFIGFTVVAGEEISWGQRIVGFETPEEIAERNTQGEFNIHNNDIIFGHVYRAYGLLTMSGIAAAVLRSVWRSFPLPALWSKRGYDFLNHFAPQTVLIGWFVPMLVFVVLRETISHAYLNPWEEVMEGFLAGGVFLTFAEKAGFTWLAKK